MDQNSWICNGTKGCTGKYTLNNIENDHILAKDCPYNFELWKTVIDGTNEVPNRLMCENISVRRYKIVLYYIFLIVVLVTILFGLL